MQRGDVPADVAGSWAGAIGQPQFMPTTFRDYAVDFDGDGRRDLRDSLPDVFASAANYLAASGWNRHASWGYEVSLPEQFDYMETGLEVEKPVYEWQSLGVRGIDGTDLADSDIEGFGVAAGRCQRAGVSRLPELPGDPAVEQFGALRAGRRPSLRPHRRRRAARCRRVRRRRCRSPATTWSKCSRC